MIQQAPYVLFCIVMFNLVGKTSSVDADVPQPLLGVWAVTWAYGHKSSYSIEHSNSVTRMRIVSCSWESNDCSTNQEADVKPSRNDEYPPIEGWMEVKKIHDAVDTIYLKLIHHEAHGTYTLQPIWPHYSIMGKGVGLKAPQCVWSASTDGHGDDEFAIGRMLEIDCANKCSIRSITDKRINGVTISKSDGKCWCEIGMKRQVSDPTYNSCFLKDAGPTTTNSTLKPPLRCYGINGGCCTESRPCEEGDGNCYTNKQCAGSLVCGNDNCPKKSSFDSTDNCCMKPKVMEFSTSCGGVVTENIIKFPNNGGNYEKNLNCKWIIKRNHAFTLQFHRFDIEEVLGCGFDYLRVTGTRKKLCGNNIPNIDVIYHKGDEAVIIFHSDEMFHGKGFNMEISEVCWQRTSPGCVSGSNIKRYKDKSVEECKELCSKTPDCVGFEYGVEHSGDRKHYEPHDCQLNNSPNTHGCDGFFNNLDFYAMKKCETSRLSTH